MIHPWQGVKTTISRGTYYSGMSEYAEAGFNDSTFLYSNYLQKYKYKY